MVLVTSRGGSMGGASAWYVFSFDTPSMKKCQPMARRSRTKKILEQQLMEPDPVWPRPDRRAAELVGVAYPASCLSASSPTTTGTESAASASKTAPMPGWEAQYARVQSTPWMKNAVASASASAAVGATAEALAIPSAGQPLRG